MGFLIILVICSGKLGCDSVLFDQFKVLARSSHHVLFVIYLLYQMHNVIFFCSTFESPFKFNKIITKYFMTIEGREIFQHKKMKFEHQTHSFDSSLEEKKSNIGLN